MRGELAFSSDVTESEFGQWPGFREVTPAPGRFQNREPRGAMEGILQRVEGIREFPLRPGLD